MPVTEFEQPARRIGGGAGRGRAGFAVWAVGLAGIVALGVGGRLSADSRAPTAVVTSTASASAAPNAADALLTITAPDADVTTVAVRVRGRAAPAVDHVEIRLVRSSATLGRQTVRPTGTGLYGGLFTLGAPRAASGITVVAIARDPAGVVLAEAHREIRLAALHAAVLVPPPGIRLGEDGILGSRGVDLTAYAAVAEWSYPIGRLGWRTNPTQK
jgi:hypothetical protein